MKCRTFYLAVVIILLIIPTLNPSSRSAEQKERIIFLAFEITEGSVRVVDVQVRPGKMKSRRSDSGPFTLICDLQDVDGKSLWQTAVENPLLARVEYADSTGALHSVLTRHEKARTTVRLRFVKGAHHVRFSVGSPAGNVPLRHLGTIHLNVSGEDGK